MCSIVFPDVKATFQHVHFPFPYSVCILRNCARGSVNISGHKLFYLTFSAFLGSLMTLSPVAFYSKSPLVFFRFDGTFLLIWATMEKYWATDTVDFTSHPLQGLGGFGLFWHTQWEPGLWLAANLPSGIAPTVAMTFYAVVLAVTICTLGIRLGLDPLAAIAAAWIGLLLALPYVYPTLGFDFLWGVPTDVTYLALNTAAILLFLGVGCGPPLADVARFIGLAGICAYDLMQLPNFAPVCLIVLSFFAFIITPEWSRIFKNEFQMCTCDILAISANFFPNRNDAEMLRTSGRLEYRRRRRRRRICHGN